MRLAAAAAVTALLLIAAVATPAHAGDSDSPLPPSNTPPLPPPLPASPPPPPPPLAPPARPQQAPQVVVVSERAFLTLGSDEETTLTIQIDGADAAKFVPARALASVGRVDLPRANGAPGRFVARYVAPAQRFPQVAIIVIEMANGTQRVAGATRLPLRAATEMPFRTSPDAQVTLRVADHTFGPIAADGQGRVKIPIVVPPGVGEGLARATDRDGNVNETAVDLQPAPFPRVLVLAPPQLEVGRTAPVVVYAAEPSGAPPPELRISLKSKEAQVRRVSAGVAGEARFNVQAPRRLGAGPVVLTAVKAATTPADPPANTTVSVPLVAGPAHKLTLTASAGWLIVGAEGGSTITLAAEDQYGNPSTCAGAAVSVNRQPTPIALSEWGQGTVIVATPEHYQGRDGILVEASLGAAYVAREIRLTGGPPTQLTLELSGTQVVADGQHAVEVRVHAVDQNGTPTLIPGLSWEVAGGRLGTVRKPRVGSYVADFVPRRAREPRDETIAVMASQTLRASATFRVEPPRTWLSLTPRVGVFSNLGNVSGATASVDAVLPLTGVSADIDVGLSLGYLHSELTATATAPAPPNMPATSPTPLRAQLGTHQVPVLAIARYRVTQRPVEFSVGGGAGLSLAYSRLSLSRDSNALTVTGTAQAIALQATGEAALFLPPGQLVFGLRYLWIDLGRTSQGDEVQGNSVGFVADLGYRLTW